MNLLTAGANSRWVLKQTMNLGFLATNPYSGDSGRRAELCAWVNAVQAEGDHLGLVLLPAPSSIHPPKEIRAPLVVATDLEDYPFDGLLATDPGAVGRLAAWDHPGVRAALVADVATLEAARVAGLPVLSSRSDLVLEARQAGLWAREIAVGVEPPADPPDLREAPLSLALPETLNPRLGGPHNLRLARGLQRSRGILVRCPPLPFDPGFPYEAVEDPEDLYRGSTFGLFLYLGHDPGLEVLRAISRGCCPLVSPQVRVAGLVEGQNCLRVDPGISVSELFERLAERGNPDRAALAATLRDRTPGIGVQALEAAIQDLARQPRPRLRAREPEPDLPSDRPRYTLCIPGGLPVVLLALPALRKLRAREPDLFLDLWTDSPEAVELLSGVAPLDRVRFALTSTMAERTAGLASRQHRHGVLSLQNAIQAVRAAGAPIPCGFAAQLGLPLQSFNLRVPEWSFPRGDRILGAGPVTTLHELGEPFYFEEDRDLLTQVATARALVTDQIELAAVAVACGTPCVLMGLPGNLGLLTRDRKQLLLAAGPDQARLALDRLI